MGPADGVVELVQEKVGNPLDFSRVLKAVLQNRGTESSRTIVSHLYVNKFTACICSLLCNLLCFFNFIYLTYSFFGIVFFWNSTTKFEICSEFLHIMSSTVWYLADKWFFFPSPNLLCLLLLSGLLQFIYNIAIGSPGKIYTASSHL